MAGYWISFILIAIIALFGIPYLKIVISKKKKIKTTPEQDKQANIRVVSYILFCWLCDLFYMACFIDSLICKYIFGGILLVVIFMNLAKSVSLPKDRSAFERYEMVQDFVVGVVLTVYLIYIIPNTKIQEIVIPIISAVYGGLITLVGVILTIKKSDKDRKEEEVKKAKPLVYVFDYAHMSYQKEGILQRKLMSNTFWGTLKKAKPDEMSYKIPIIPITNVDYSHCSVVGFRINKDYHLFDIGQVLPKNSKMLLLSDFNFKYKEKIDYVALLINDMLDNIYELELRVSYEKNGQETQIKIISSLSTKRTELNINM